ncbi:MAG: hypothetical protein Q9167_002240 [Letrouitia subvulpina]
MLQRPASGIIAMPFVINIIVELDVAFLTAMPAGTKIKSTLIQEDQRIFFKTMKNCTKMPNLESMVLLMIEAAEFRAGAVLVDNACG